MTAIETRAEPRAEPVTDGAVLQFQWGPIIAGGIAATALALVLHSFAVAIGLSVSSTAPTWRDASIALVLLSGLYLLLAAIVSYGFGAYLAGRMRPRLTTGAPEEIEFRDGTHGLLVWALATLLTGLLALAAVQSLSRAGSPTSASAAPSASVAGESLIAFDLDRLFRGDRRPDGDINYARTEAARILLTASSHRGLQPEDRSYLVRRVAARTGARARRSRTAGRRCGRARKREYQPCAAERRDPGFHDRGCGPARGCRGLVRGLCWRAASRRTRCAACLVGLGYG